jgi:alpha 1,3-glucosidase
LISSILADVGGFFYNPSAELLTRWYQAGIYSPFFRGHAHLDTKRREPWIFGEPYTSIIRDAIVTRYRMLPYWYLLFRHAQVHGLSPMRYVSTNVFRNII